MKRSYVLGVVASLACLIPACSSSDDGATPTSVRSPSASAPSDSRGPSDASTSQPPGSLATTTTEVDTTSVFPGADWVVADPAEHGVDAAGLESAREYAFQPEHHTQGVVVIRGGEIVAEWYADGVSADSWAASWSMAKSFTSATTGIAIEEGAISSVDASAAVYIPEWVGTDRAAITIKDLLQMNSGLDWDEDYRGAEAEIVNMVTRQPDQLAYAVSIPLAVEPGTRWSYSSGDTMVLSGVVQTATGQPLDEYATEKLLEPIGLDHVEWWRDANGHTLGYCCFDTTSRDFARLGLLYLHNGRWGDRQVVPEQWVRDSITPVANSNGEYGYQWWTYDIANVPSDTFLAQGIDGQFIYVIPSLDLVVVRNGIYVKDPGPAIADPALFPLYPSGSLIPGKGTEAPGDWRSSEFLGPIVNAIHD